MLASPLQGIGCELLVEGTRGRAEEFTRAPLPEPALDLRHDLVLDASKPIPEHHGSDRIAQREHDGQLKGFDGREWNLQTLGSKQKLHTIQK